MRKIVRQKIRQVICRYHLVIFLAGLAAVLMGLEFSGNMELPVLYNRSTDVFRVAADKLETSMEILESVAKAAIEQSKNDGESAVFGRSRGVFAYVVNSVVSGTVLKAASQVIGEMAERPRPMMAFIAAAIVFPVAGIRNIKAKLSEKDRDYQRKYPVISLILIFFVFSVAGWLWEVGMHLVTSGEFVNRGVLHGPWLPIYGTGSVLILVALNTFRKKPVAEFFAVVILCGCVEYFTSYCLEIMHGGQKWWDYSGYFLNLNGRICAEGLLLFGLCGMALVYLAAPALDDWFRGQNRKAMALCCVVLIVLFLADNIYSQKHPNASESVPAGQGAGKEYRMDRGRL